MDIRVTRTGKVFYRIDAALAAILLEALPGSFEQVAATTAAPMQSAVPRFGITELTSGYVAVQRIWGAETAYFDAFPHWLRATWPDVPPEIEKEYTRRFAHRPEVHSSEQKVVSQFEAFKKKLLG